jgi:transposase
MVTIGHDAHLKTSTMTVLDHDGKKLFRKKLNNDPQELLSFLRGIPGPKQLAMETCYNWPVFYELFKNDVTEFHLLHAKKLRSVIESQAKTDGNDSDEIAYLIHSGRPLVRSYVANMDTRCFRRLLRTRVSFSLDITRIKNQVHALLNANTFYSQRPKSFKDIFCKRGLEYLRSVQLPQEERFVLDRLIDKKIELEHRRDEFDKYIQSLNFHAKDLKWLETVPGMRGMLFKYIVLSEIDNIHRFRNARSLAAYCGLVPKEHSSGDKNRKGGLRSECNQFLRWAMIQAVLPAIIKDKGLRHYYQSIKERSNSSAARIATARLVLKAVYCVLKEQRSYRMQAVNRV